MPETTASAAAVPLTLQDRLELANQLFHEYHTRCFWHCPRELVVTQDLIPTVVNGLRKHGGRRGFILAEKLLARDATQRPAAGEPRECP